MRISGYLRASCACWALCTAAAASAQEATHKDPSPATSAEDNRDIVVTATRDKSLQSRTPISMKVYGAAEILQKNITTAAALVANDSSLNINQGGGQPFIAMRGVQSSDTTEVGDPAVPVAIDNFFTNRSYALNIGFFDLDRIEVLRGPQGTLFGRNAVGGLVTLYTADPAKTFGGFTQIIAGDYGTINTTGAINVPLGDTLQTRISFATNRHNGYRDLGVLGRGDNQDSQAIRLKLAWQPTDDLSVSLSYQHSNLDETGSTHYTINGKFLAPAPLVDLGGNPVLDGMGNPTFGNPIDTSAHFTGDPEDLAAGVGIPPLEQIKQDTILWRVEYGTANGISLTYLGGYDSVRWKHEASTGVEGVNSSFEQIERPRTVNQELRIASPQGGRLSWQAGAFYFQERNDTRANTLLSYLTPDQYNPLYFKFPHVRSKSVAGYAQAGFMVTDQIKLTAGGRYTRDSKESDKNGQFCGFFFDFSTFPNNFLNPPCAPSGGRLPAEGTWTYHLGADFQANSTTLIYAKADKGYKSGGYNNGTPYNPELNYAYEAGLKTRLFDNALTFNAAGFYSIYRDFQVLTSQPVSSGLTSKVINAGRAKIYGLEVGGVANSTSAGAIDFNATLLHARFTDFTTANDRSQVVSGVIPPNVSYRGNQLPNSPDLTFTIGYQIRFPMFGGSITPRLEGKYTSDRYFLSANTRDSLVESNFIANAYLTFASKDDRFAIEGFVRNIGDIAVISDFGASFFGQLAPSPRFGFNSGYTTAYGFAPPRTYGARLRVNF